MFIPLGDDNSLRTRFPFVVYAIIAVNFLVWWLQLQGGDAFTYALSVVPYEITHHVDLTSLEQASIGSELIEIQHYPGPRPISLTILTSMFMHASWLHILGNMLYLWIFGDQIEDLLGHLRFAIFYLLCGMAATAAHIIAGPESVLPCLGASGAIAGVLGAYLLYFHSNRVRVLIFRVIVVLPAAVVLGFWLILQFIGQMQSPETGGGVAYFAHIGGFVAGFILITIMRRRGIALTR